MLKERDIRHYILRNLLYEVPGLNRHFFVREIRKIVPSIQAADISYAERFGGLRPQLIDKASGKLRMGEAKITNDAGLIFNMTPSPGGTSCLGSGETDMRSIAAYLGARIDEQGLASELLMGYDDTRGQGDATAAVATESEAVPLAEAV